MINKRNKAMTLIELIITLGILVIMTGVISNFFITNYTQLNSAEDKVDLQVEVNRIVSDISTNLIQATGINVTNKNESGQYDGFYEVEEFSIQLNNDDSEE